MINTKRPKKRFTSHRAIIGAIDDVQHEMVNDTKLIAAYEAETHGLRDWFAANPHHPGFTEKQTQVWHGKFGRLKLVKNELEIRKRAASRHEGRLGRLKAVLAEFDTAPMAFLADESVVMK